MDDDSTIASFFLSNRYIKRFAPGQIELMKKDFETLIKAPGNMHDKIIKLFSSPAPSFLSSGHTAQTRRVLGLLAYSYLQEKTAVQDRMVRIKRHPGKHLPSRHEGIMRARTEELFGRF